MSIDKKDNQIFLIYREKYRMEQLQTHIYEEGLPSTLNEEMRNYFTVYE
jgi:hypothetical protein